MTGSTRSARPDPRPHGTVTVATLTTAPLATVPPVPTVFLPPGKESQVRNEDGCDGGEPILVIVLLVVSLMGAWVFLRDKISQQVPPPPPPPPSHPVALAHLLSEWGVFAALVLGPLATWGLLRWRNAWTRPAGDLDPRLTPASRKWLSPGDVWLIGAVIAAVAGLWTGWGLVVLFAAGQHDTPFTGPGWQWEVAAAVAGVAVRSVFSHQTGVFGGTARYGGHTGSSMWRSTVRDTAREHGIPIAAAAAWHRVLTGPGTGGCNRYFWEPNRDDLGGWYRMVGVDAPLWHAAGYTLLHAAELAWRTPAPTVEEIERRAEVLDAAPDPESLSCVVGPGCPSHDTEFQWLLGQAVL